MLSMPRRSWSTFISPRGREGAQQRVGQQLPVGQLVFAAIDRRVGRPSTAIVHRPLHGPIVTRPPRAPSIAGEDGGGGDLAGVEDVVGVQGVLDARIIRTPAAPCSSSR
jgi:hypothetical protein